MCVIIAYRVFAEICRVKIPFRKIFERRKAISSLCADMGINLCEFIFRVRYLLTERLSCLDIAQIGRYWCELMFELAK